MNVPQTKAYYVDPLGVKVPIRPALKHNHFIFATEVFSGEFITIHESKVIYENKRFDDKKFNSCNKIL